MIKNASSEAISFMEDVLQWDPNKRPTANELLSHPFLKGFELRINSYENNLTSLRKKDNEDKERDRENNKERYETISRSKLSSKKSNNDKRTPFILKSKIKNKIKYFFLLFYFLPFIYLYR